MTRPPDLIYSVDEHPPWAILVVSALQHIALMAITLIFPIILAREGNLSGAWPTSGRPGLRDQHNCLADERDPEA
jgi:Trk-type K+ transport system membrane component